ncbi:MAG: 50S ribosomal protein L6 [Candidatus Omnitrophota bacterium]|nr:MAG: 50S ribosomal protein L6 [Candidatus Omnitrophota bacterium]
MSRIGKRPINIPEGAKVRKRDNVVYVEGPKGKLDYSLMQGIDVDIKDNTIAVIRSSDDKQHRALHGLARALIANMIKGVMEGFSKQLEIIGVGFKAQVSGKKLTLNLGFSHTIEYRIPDGIAIETPKPTQIVVKGIDKQAVGETAAEIRDFYKPEPYKGKGIRYVGEYVRKKAGKTVA